MPTLPRELLIRIGATNLAGLQRDGKKVTSTINRIGREAKDVSFAFGTATAGATALTVGLGKLAQAGGRYINVQQAFNRLSGDGVRGLNELREASQGLSSDYDLMVGFNRSAALGVSKTTEEFGALITVAEKLGRTLGLEGGAAEAMDKLNLGIGRQSRLLLDDLGIIITATEANKKYAEQLGKQASDLTELEKKEAFRTEAIRKANEMVERSGDLSLTAGDGYTQLTVAVDNLGAAFTRMVAKSVEIGGFFGVLRNAAEGAQITLDAMAAGVSVEGLGVLQSISAITDVRGAAARLADEWVRLAELQERSRTPGATVLGIPEVDPQELKDQIAIVEALEQRVKQLGRTSSETADGPPLLPPGPSEKVLKILEDTDKKLQAIDSQAEVFGPRFDDAGERVKLFRDAVVALLEEGLQPSAAAVQSMVRDFRLAQLAATNPFAVAGGQVPGASFGHRELGGIQIFELTPQVDETREAIERTRISTERWLGLGVSLTQSFAGALADFATHGASAFQRFADHAIRQLLRIAAQFAIFKIFDSLFPGSKFVSGLGQAFGFEKFFEVRAGGGPVTSRHPYLVGEQGPELFVPNTSGGVVSNDALAGGLRARLDVSGMPAASNPLAAARDGDWLRFLARSNRELALEGFGG